MRSLVLLWLLASPLTEHLTPEQRRDLVKATPKDELAAFMQQTPTDQLIALGQRAISELGTYRYFMKKQERVKGKLLPVQEVLMTVREQPFAVRFDFVGGPGKGRRVLFNPAVRADEFRVREPGLLSVIGGLWISVDSSLAKSDSNHTVREAGVGNLLRRFVGDLKKSQQYGGFKVTYEGWDALDHFCAVYEAPNGGKGFDQARSRICTDLQSAIPARIEGFDAAGTLMERFEFSGIEHQQVADDFFTLKGADL